MMENGIRHKSRDERQLYLNETLKKKLKKRTKLRDEAGTNLGGPLGLRKVLRIQMNGRAWRQKQKKK